MNSSKLITNEFFEHNFHHVEEIHFSKHAKKRARQRYHFSKQKQAAFLKFLFNRQNIVFKWLSKRNNSQVFIAKFEEKQVLFVYSKEHKRIITFLPKDSRQFAKTRQLLERKIEQGKKRQGAWSATEKRIIISMHKDWSIKEMAKMLGRTYHSVQKKVQQAKRGGLKICQVGIGA